MSFKVYAQCSYHSNADSIYPYMDNKMNSYNTFSPLPMTMLFYMFGVEFTHDIYKLPTKFQNYLFSFGIQVWRYAPGTSEISNTFSLYSSTTNAVTSPSRETVGDKIFSSSFKYCFCLLPLAHVLPLVLPSIFCESDSLLQALFLSSCVSIDGNVVSTTVFAWNSPSSSSLDYFKN